MTIDCPITPAQREAIYRYARQRQDPKTLYQVENRKHDSKRSDLDIQIQGMAGELAFATIIGQRVNQIDGIGGDGGQKDYVVGGCSIAVKTIRRGHQWLIAPKEDWPLKADLYVLMEDIGPDLIRLVRWTTATTFNDYVARSGKIDIGQGPSFCFPRCFMAQTANLPFDTILPERGDDHAKRPLRDPGHWTRVHRRGDPAGLPPAG